MPGRLEKRCTIDATTKQHLTCENIQELHGFIVAELSFLVHFVVLLFPRFTYGNYAAKLAHYNFWASSDCMTRAEGRIHRTEARKLRHIHIMEKQGL